jgi:hypothetical protein
MWSDINVSEDLFTSIFGVMCEDGGGRVLRNVGNLPEQYRASKSGSLRLDQIKFPCIEKLLSVCAQEG